MTTSTPKTYALLSSEEQNRIILRLAELRQLRQHLTPMPKFLTREQQQYVRDAATLLQHFPNCLSNVMPIIQASVINARHANRVLYLLDYMADKVSSELTVVTHSGERVILLDQQQSLRRGRPTAEESEQRQRERQQKARAEAISKLTGRRIAQPEAASIDTTRPTDTSRRKQEPDLFSQAVTTAIEDASADSSPIIPNSSFLTPNSSTLHSLREWSWLLPDHLAAGVKTLRDLRTQHASHSEQAKLLMEQGAKSEAIAEHTQAAAAINDKIAKLYADIDLHLATMYCMLSEVNPSYMNAADHYTDRGGLKALLADLQPYYNKLTASATVPSADFGTQAPVPDASPSGSSADNSTFLTPRFSLLSRANKLNDAWLAATTRDPERDKRVHTIKAYFSRKDVSATPARLEKLRAYRNEAETLKVDADTLASMDLIIKDCERQIAAQS